MYRYHHGLLIIYISVFLEEKARNISKYVSRAGHLHQAAVYNDHKRCGCSYGFFNIIS